jgi:CRP-like cAMP-binding protein
MTGTSPMTAENGIRRSLLPRESQTNVFTALRHLSHSSLDGPIGHVYFPTSGLISLLLVLEDGSVAEVGGVGNEGMVGLPLFLGVRTSRTRAFVQIPGQALRMKAQVFLQETRQGGPLSGLLLRYTQALWHRAERLTACNTRHSIEQRLARWLLVTHDRVQADQFEITQEFLAQMLGVHRLSITLAASNLQKRAARV